MHAQLALRLIAPRPRPAKVSAYYCTTPLTVQERAQAIARAEAQDQRVLAIYRCSDRPLTPSEAHQQLEACGHREPIVSIRRAINTLTNAGALVKLSTTARGPWGAKEHHWALVQPQGGAA